MFRSPFASPFTNPISSPGGIALPWLSGGVPSANCIGAYNFKGAASYAASKINLANPGTYDATNGTAYPTWDVTNGAKFAKASSQYLETGIVPHVGWSMIMRFTNAMDAYSGGFSDVYNGNETSRFGIYGVYAINQFIFSYGSYQIVNGTFTSGIAAIAAGQPYKNGSPVGTLMTSFSTGNSRSLGIGRQNGSSPTYSSEYVQALWVYNIDISTYMSALTTAMAAL